MTIDELYERAEKEGIEVDEFDFKEIVSASFPEGWIAFNKNMSLTVAEFLVAFAHELGHIETGSFYNIYSKVDTRERYEILADRHAITMLVPETDFYNAIKQGYTECWQIAEYFDIPCDFAHKAMEYYSLQKAV